MRMKMSTSCKTLKIRIKILKINKTKSISLITLYREIRTLLIRIIKIKINNKIRLFINLDKTIPTKIKMKISNQELISIQKMEDFLMKAHSSFIMCH